MYTFNEVLSIVNTEIEQINWKRVPTGLYEPIEYILSLGGKRLRPAITLMSYDLYADDIMPAVKPALGLEVFHNFTLLHDDIIDEAPIRRGKETVYKKWNINTAILSGDTMFAIAYGQLSGSNPKHLPELMQVFTQTAIQVCEGQQYDIDFETSGNVNIQAYLDMIRLKTAVLLAASLKIGAIIGGASAEDCEKIYQFGENLGMAFQLQDDMLDAFGNESTFGKKTGGDIVNNKKTYLYLKALECSTENDASRLKELYEHKGMKDDDKIHQVLEIFKKADIEKLSEALILDYYHKAMEQMEQIILPQSNKLTLITLAASMLKRKF